MAKYPPGTARIQDRFTRGAGIVLQGRQIMAAAAGASAAALPVRPGEKPWTEAELKKVRQQLQDIQDNVTLVSPEAEVDMLEVYCAD